MVSAAPPAPPGVIARLVAASARHRGLTLLGVAAAFAWGVYAIAAHAARRHPRSLGRPGDRVHGVAGARPDAGRGSDHLSDLDHAALGAARALRARAVVLRALLRERDLRGRHRSVLGPQPRARVHEHGGGAPARGRHADARARRHRRRLGLRVRAGRSQRQARSGRAAQPPGLEPALRARERAGRRRGRVGRRLRARVPGAGRPESPAQLRHPALGGGGRRARREPGDRRRRDRDRRARAGDPRPRAGGERRRARAAAAARERAGHARHAARRGGRLARPRDAPRPGRARRRGRGGGRHRGDALGRERARRDRRRQAADSTRCAPACPRASRSSRPTTARS